MNKPPPTAGADLVGVPAPPELHAAFDALAELIDRHERFLVVSHASPDGDAIGSTLAMGLLLEQLGKSVTFFNVDPVPYNFTFLPGADRVVSALADDADIEATIVLDCAEPGRVGEGFPEAGWGDAIGVIDHHKTYDPDFADAYVRDTTAAATGELVFWLVGYLGAELTREIATSLYACVMTDTGSFRYSNTSRTTFRIAGELLEAGVEPWEMTSNIYENQPAERLALLGLVLDTLERSECGRLAFLRIEQAMFDETGTGGEMTDGFINYARSVRGVEVATQLREIGPDDWKISFRSRGKVDVSALAERFGGGGHHNAAGCRIQGTPRDVEQKLADALTELLDTSD